jgi:hypothetical protein
MMDWSKARIKAIDNEAVLLEGNIMIPTFVKFSEGLEELGDALYQEGAKSTACSCSSQCMGKLTPQH